MRPVVRAALAGLLIAACSEPEKRLGGLGAPGESSATPGEGAVVGGGTKKSPTGSPSTSPTSPTSSPVLAACPPEDPPSTTVCTSSPFQAVPPPVALYLMIDRSGSMNDSTSSGQRKWDALREAIDDFLLSPPLGDLSAAAQFFPSGLGDCSSSAYEDPAVNLAAASQVRASLVSTMGAIQPGGNTPTAPALQGAIEQARRWARQYPKTSVAVVLATDGQPSTCEPLDAQGLGALAADGATGSSGNPPIPTFVVGILGTNDLATGAYAVLDAIAQGGGTGKATLVVPSNDLTQQMAAALRAAANQRVACSFALPSSVTDSNLSQVNVVLEGSCGHIQLPYTSGACSGDGWHYDVSPKAGSPRSIELCPTSCERFRAGDKVTIEVGCATKGWPAN